MTVQTAKLQIRVRNRFLDCFVCFAGFQCKAELAVNLSGTDKVMGVCIYARLDAEQDRALLDYYAIAPEKRNYGYGSRGLEALLKKFKNHKYIFEIETQDEKAENAEERKRRKAFYLRNGLQETGLFVNVYDTDFEILTPDGELTFWEYVDFLREVMYEEYVQILRPTLIAMKK